MTASRDWDSRAYRRFRATVRKRDGYKCRMCGSRRRLQVHHISRWADSPELRFAVANGITLCRRCHNRVSGNEGAYAPLFHRLVNPDGWINMQLRLRREAERAEGTTPEVQGD